MIIALRKAPYVRALMNIYKYILLEQQKTVCIRPCIKYRIVDCYIIILIKFGNLMI